MPPLGASLRAGTHSRAVREAPPQSRYVREAYTASVLPGRTAGWSCASRRWRASRGWARVWPRATGRRAAGPGLRSLPHRPRPANPKTLTPVSLAWAQAERDCTTTTQRCEGWMHVSGGKAPHVEQPALDATERGAAERGEERVRHHLAGHPLLGGALHRTLRSVFRSSHSETQHDQVRRVGRACTPCETSVRRCGRTRKLTVALRCDSVRAAGAGAAQVHARCLNLILVTNAPSP